MATVRASSPARHPEGRSDVSSHAQHLSLDPNRSSRKAQPWGGSLVHDQLETTVSHGKKAVHRFLLQMISNLRPKEDIPVTKGNTRRRNHFSHVGHGRPPHAMRHKHHYRGHESGQVHSDPLAAHTSNEILSAEASPPISLEPFLARASLAELAFTTLLSDLSNVAYNVDDPSWKAAMAGRGADPASSLMQDWMAANQLSFVSCSETRALGPLPSVSSRKGNNPTQTGVNASPVSSSSLKPSGPLETDSQEAAMNMAAEHLLMLSPPNISKYGYGSGSSASPAASSEVFPVNGSSSPCEGPSSQRLFRPDVEYSLILGSMDTMLHGSRELLLKAEQRAKLMLEHSGSLHNLAALTGDTSHDGSYNTNSKNEHCSVASNEIADSDDDIAEELPLHVALTLKSIGEMEYWAEDGDLPRHSSVGLRSPGGGLYAGFSSIDIGSRAGSIGIAPGGGMKSPGVAAAEQARLSRSSEGIEEKLDAESSVGHHQSHQRTMVNFLPSRFLSLPRSSKYTSAGSSSAAPGDASTSNNYPTLGSDVSVNPVALGSDASVNAVALSTPFPTDASSPADPMTAPSLSSLLESLGRLLPFAADSGTSTSNAPTSGTLPPPETSIPWLAADDLESGVRYISLQGTNRLEHWSINFRFEPTPFEDPSLDLLVHRGMYDAAKALYPDIAPLVRQQLASSDTNKVCLTGHSLGGSVASVLMLMLVHRGDAPVERMAPCLIFGAPAVFCEQQRLADRDKAAINTATGLAKPVLGEAVPKQRHALARLGLSDHQLVNVMMSMDMIPRSFACDFTPMADTIQQLMPSLRGHAPLTSTHTAQGHRLIYDFLGTHAVLKPRDDEPFVHPSDLDQPCHMLLPREPGLYFLDETTVTDIAMLAAKDAALLYLMNTPHPVDMLSQPDSYGAHGTIMRYHRITHYSAALASLIKTSNLNE